MEQFLDVLVNGPARYALSHHFSAEWTLVFCLWMLFVELGCFVLIVVGIMQLVRYWRTLISLVLRNLGVGGEEEGYLFLQLLFPSNAAIPLPETKQLHLLLRDMVKYRGTWDRLAARKQPYAFEIVASRDEGIRYIIRIPKRERDAVKRMIVAFSPRVRIKEVDDYLSLAMSAWSLSELQLANDFTLPLSNEASTDPIAYLIGQMTNMLPDELVSFQLVTVPMLASTHSVEVRHARKIQAFIARRKEISPLLVQQNRWNWKPQVLFAPVWLVGLGMKFLMRVRGGMMSRDGNGPSDDMYDQEVKEYIKKKLDQPLFETTLRIFVTGSDPEMVRRRMEAVVGSFRTYSTSTQSLMYRRNKWMTPNWQLRQFRRRELTNAWPNQPMIISSEEMAKLYHFPEGDYAKAEGLVKSRSPEVPIPISMKHADTELDVVVGVNQFSDEAHAVGLTLEQRQKHTYIIGKTGMGKTTLLKYAIYQDMVNGKGLAILDPHGDLFRELLTVVPEHRVKDVIVFDPSDRDFPIGLNILDPGIDFIDDEDRVDWITSAVLSIFRKLSDERQWGPRMEHILRNVTMTALHVPEASLMTLQQLLTDTKYQKKVAAQLDDPILKQFWKNEFSMLGTMQMASVTAPLTHRLGHFITSKLSRHILLQEKTTVHIADAMDSGKIILVNLSKGDIGEDQSEFFGTMLTTLIWMAAYQRTKIPEKERRDFFVYVDEFQNFVTPQFAAITSEGRKFHISLIVSHQNIAQIDDKNLVKEIAGNAATIITLRANPEDEMFLLPFMRPAIASGDIVNLAPHHFFMKVATKDSEEAFSGETIPIDVHENEAVREKVVVLSRDRYGVVRAEVERRLNLLFEADVSQKKGGVTKRRLKEAELKRTPRQLS